MWFRLIPIRRGVAREAVARFFPEKPPSEREAIVRKSFQHLCTSLLEAIAVIGMSDEKLRRRVVLEGVEEIVAAGRSERRGAILMTGHIGSFEVCMASFELFYPQIPRMLIARIPTGGFARGMLEGIRRRGSLEGFPPR